MHIGLNRLRRFLRAFKSGDQEEGMGMLWRGGVSCYQVDITGILDRISGVDIKFGGNELMPVKELSAT